RRCVWHACNPGNRTRKKLAGHNSIYEVNCSLLNYHIFVGRIRRSRRIRHDKAHIDICLSPALRGFFRQKQGDSDEKSVIYLAKLCFIVYPCQTARHKAAECISPF
ncbi:hypothetical protein, partial [Escherichia coli]|uniref:hypothetical protein n=1 Tax=Escherichia coli TaxID=562 RepID=UPI00374D31DA